MHNSIAHYNRGVRTRVVRVYELPDAREVVPRVVPRGRVVCDGVRQRLDQLGHPRVALRPGRLLLALVQLARHLRLGHSRGRRDHARVRLHGQRGPLLRLHLARRGLRDVPLRGRRQLLRWLRQHLVRLPGRLPGHLLRLHHRGPHRQGPRRSADLDQRHCAHPRMPDRHRRARADPRHGQSRARRQQGQRQAGAARQPGGGRTLRDHRQPQVSH